MSRLTVRKLGDVGRVHEVPVRLHIPCLRLPRVVGVLVALVTLVVTLAVW